MKKVVIDWKNFPWHSLVFVLSTISMIGLGVAGFVVPPLGIIDQSVFQYGCLLCVPLTVSQIRPVLQEAHYFKTTLGNLSVEARGNGSNGRTPAPSDPPPNEEAE